MILNFHGGVRPDHRTIYAKQKIKYMHNCSVICIDAGENAKTAVKSSSSVAKGTLIGYSNDTPVYSPISGVFRGIGNIKGKNYFVVVADNKNNKEIPHKPETRALTSLTHEDITEAAKKYAIIDSRSGMPLWKLLENAQNCRRVVIDCTESDPKCAINYRLCIEKAKSIVGGAKVLVHATNALKCVFAIEHYRNGAIESLSKYASDEQLFAAAPLEEKYPYTDSVLMYALYIKSLKTGESPLDHNVLIVSAETACALYDAMVSGMPQIGRYISYCGEGLSSGGNLYVPKGITIRDIAPCFDPAEEGSVTIENNLLSGKRFVGAISDKTRAIINVKPDSKPRALCVACGKCVSACPVGLIPRDILSVKENTLSHHCIECGCCEYVCPSGIPLVKLIKNIPETNETNDTEVE